MLRHNIKGGNSFLDLADRTVRAPRNLFPLEKKSFEQEKFDLSPSSNIDKSCIFSGTAIISGTKAALWTDGRYFLQANMELDCNWILQREGKQIMVSLKEPKLSKIELRKRNMHYIFHSLPVLNYIWLSLN